MSSRAEIERVRFVHGQRLRSDDLADSAAGELRRQELHLVAAHRTWGIAMGLEVEASSFAAGVRAGAAFDRLGRALVLDSETTAFLPGALSGTSGPVELILMLRGGSAVVRFAAQGDVSPGLDVPLAGFELASGKLGEPDLGSRRAARSMARARLGSGTATVDIDPGAWPAHAGGFVDTSVAGFARNPSYVITRVAGEDAGSDAAGARDAFVWIADPQPAGFDVCVWAPGGNTKDPYTLELDWLGAESPPGCPPVPRILKEMS